MINSVPYVIALYIRLSIEDNKTESLSIENQKHTLHRYVDSMNDIKNYDILEFVDNGYSGTNFERPAVQELLDLVRDGKINCIIVKDFTRFGRNSIEVGYFIERVFPLYNIRFIAINDDFDSSRFEGDTGGINLAFKYLISEFYSRDLSIKYKSAKYVKFRRGEYQSKLCPYGYRKSADGRMEPDEQTAPNVRLIFELARDGCGPAEIVRQLFRRGLPTPGEYKAANGFTGHDISRCGRIWHPHTVSRILDDERYVGVYIIGKREVTEVGGHRSRMKDESQWIKIPDHHPAIISRALFDEVQAVRPHIKCAKKIMHTYPLRGKVFCGYCRHALSRTSDKKRAFRCQNSSVDQNAPCHGLRILEADLEATLYEILSRQAQIILNLDNLIDVGMLDIQLAKQADYSKRIDNCGEQKRILYEQLLLKEISMEDYNARKKGIDAELDRLQKIYSILAAQTAQMQMDETSQKAKTKLAQEIIRSDRLTQGLADALVDRVHIYAGNQVEIAWKLKDFCTED